MTWPSLPLEECASFLSGGTPNKQRSEFWDGQIPWVSSAELTSHFIDDTKLHISTAGLEYGSRLVPAGTIFAVVRGMSLATEFRISLSRAPMAFNQDVKAIIPKRGIDGEFLFYALSGRAEEIRDLATEAAHGTKKLEMSRLTSFTIQVPDWKTQRKIANVAGTYDNLIAANQRRIQLLEESARLLYREWFVRLRFPGHEAVPVTDGVPEGWRKKALGDHVTLNYGKGLKETDRIDGKFPVYGSSGIVGNHHKPLVAGPAIIVGRKGNVGSLFYSHRPCFPIDTVYFISPEQTSYFLYLALHGLKFISSDAAVPGLNRNYAYSLQLLIPSSEVLSAFETKMQPIFEQTNALLNWNEKLRQARALLLPKLMSGALDIGRISEPKEVAA